jgi:hypothetical protein
MMRIRQEFGSKMYKTKEDLAKEKRYRRNYRYSSYLKRLGDLMPIYEYQGQRYDLKDGLSPDRSKN